MRLKRIILFMLLACIAVAGAAGRQTATRTAEPGGYAPFPTPDSGYVTDLASVLSPAQEERIEQWLMRVEKQTGVEIAVVTVQRLNDYPGTPNTDIERFATGLFNRWGIGNLPDNNGVLLLVSIGDRKARIELGAGYGRSRDGDAAAIMDGTIIPRFRKGNYADGIEAGVRALMLEFAGVGIGWNWPLIGGLAAIPVLGLIAFSLLRNGQRGWGWITIGLLLVVVLGVIFVGVRVLRALGREGHSSGWSAGGFGGGFGGGSSGGGGATGSW